MRKQEMAYLIANCIRLALFLLLLAYITSCAVVPKYDVRERDYCPQKDYTYRCDGYLEEQDDFFEQNMRYLSQPEPRGR